MTKKTIFLGGTANHSTWRETLIRQLDLTKLAYFNPVVKDWNEAAQQAEIKQRATCEILLYVISSEMLGFYAIAEVVDDSNKRPQQTIFCYLEEGFNQHQIKSLVATARLVQANGSQVFTNLTELATYLNNQTTKPTSSLTTSTTSIIREQLTLAQEELPAKSCLPSNCFSWKS